MTRILVAVFVAFVFAGAVQAGEPAGDPAIDAIVAKALETGPFPGMSVIVEKGGKVVYAKGAGLADIELNVPVTPETIFAVGSITKSFTGLAIAQLVEKGKVDLDAPVGKYLTNVPAPARDLHIRNLLNHTSGLVNYTDLPDFPRSSQDPTTREKMISYFASKPLMFKPGTRFSYSNSGTFLLGLVIEKVTGADYETYVTKNIFEPFGMKSSSVYDWHKIVKGRAKGYESGKNGLENAQRYDPLVPFSAGVILSTTGDLLKYRKGVFSSKLVSDKVRKQLTTHEPLADGTPIPYALGCLIVTTFEGHRKILHAGDIFGFAAQYAYYPDDDVTIIVLTNHDGAAYPPSTMERKIARQVLGIPAPVLKDLPLDDAAQKSAGDYNIGPMRFGVDVLGFVVKDGKLHLSFGGVKSGAPLLPLRHQGNNTFFSIRDDEHKFVFDGKGTLEMTFYEGVFKATKAP